MDQDRYNSHTESIARAFYVENERANYWITVEDGVAIRVAEDPVTGVTVREEMDGAISELATAASVEEVEPDRVPSV